VKVILVDDHAIVRQGLRSLLDSDENVEIISEASDGREAVNQVAEHLPDMVIMDIAMPYLSGLEATRQVKKRFPEVKVVVLSMYAEDSHVTHALQAGAHAYVLKSAVFEELKLALEAVSKGEYYVSPAVSKVLVDQMLGQGQTSSAPSPYDTLTGREREVLQLMAEEHTRNEIARILTISPKTVDKHSENIKRKLDIRQKEDLIKYSKSIGIQE